MTGLLSALGGRGALAAVLLVAAGGAVAVGCGAARRARPAGAAGVATGTAAVAVTTLGPAAGVDIGVSLVPGAGTLAVWRLSGDPALVAGLVVGNLVLFAPVGGAVALLAGRRRPLLAAAAGGALLSAVAEVGQWLLPLGRSTDIDDWLLNTAGALLGGALAVASRRWGRDTAGTSDRPAG